MSGHDGIAWREWSEEAFAEAQAQDKPVLLDIGAVWCHWCHVMDHGIDGDSIHTGTYSHPLVQQLVEEHFIPIKVDNDRRPDINARYNMGGWPTTAFLTPDGETLYGETYVPPQRMTSLLEHIADLYENQRDQLAEQAAEMRERRRDAETSEPAPGDLDPKTVATVIASIKSNFDFAYGGFGREPKFPHPAALTLTLEQFAVTGDPELRTIAEKTLRGMDSGGMYDRYAGGFFRYSTTRDWSIPHFEKMLEDNAKLTSAYALASVVLGDDISMETVRSAHGWLLRDMLDPETGTFAGSQDADEEERYYGKSLDVRAAMPTPFIDRTVYTNWNALMVSSLVARYMLTGEPEILDAAKKTFVFLAGTMAPPSEGDMVSLRHFFVDGKPQGGPGLLMDQVAFIAAALDLYEASGVADYLDDAYQAALFMMSELEDKMDGGFHDLRPSDGAIGELARPKKEIGENADAAFALCRLSAFTGDPTFQQSAERALRAFSVTYSRTGFFGAQYARAVDALTRPALHIVIVGDRERDDTQSLQRVAWKAVAAGKTVQTIDPTLGPPTRIAEAYPPTGDGTACAYVCVGTVCLAPASTPAELRDRIFEALEMRSASKS